MSPARAIRHRRFLPASFVLSLLSAHRLLATPLATAVEDALRPGVDLFVTVPVALLRETPEPTSRILARLPIGTALTLVDAKGASLSVRAGSSAPPDVVHAGSGFIARGGVAAFAPG